MIKHLIAYSVCCTFIVLASKKFPDGFKFGAATAAFQIEGAWNVSDKGEGIWDRYVHNHPDWVLSGGNGDVACDSYHLYKRDVEIAEEMGLDFYRFSISWPRLLPSGISNRISEDGTRYYNALIDELISKNITPVVTLYHWDLPQKLQDLGGWANPMMSHYFQNYARVAFKLFGDRVKIWQTFNEPRVVCLEGYGQKYRAPGIDEINIGFLCGHILLIAHAKAYHLYDENFRKEQGGRIGITLSSHFYIPETKSAEDRIAADNYLQFDIGWFANPIFSKNGDYHKIMKDNVAKYSAKIGFSASFLPVFKQKQIEYIRGSADFLGFNHYTAYIAKRPESDMSQHSPFTQIVNAIMYQPSEWPPSASGWLKYVPSGFKNILKWISNEYNNPEVIIMENGYSTNDDDLDDQNRIIYLRSYMESMLEAMDEGCNVTGYLVWSLIDNMEWLAGYNERFGLYHVDYNSENKTRSPKASAKFYKNVISTRMVN